MGSGGQAPPGASASRMGYNPVIQHIHRPEHLLVAIEGEDDILGISKCLLDGV